MKKKKYNNGGPIEPNIQTLGNIKFDSNTSRRGNDGEMIVKDINTGKDYGVIRKPDGSYTWYNPNIGGRYKPNIPRAYDLKSDMKNLKLIDRWAADAMTSDEDIKVMNEVLDALDYYSNNRVDGKMTDEEVKFRKLLLDVEPFGYDVKDKVKDYKKYKNLSEEERGKIIEAKLKRKREEGDTNYEERRAYFAKYLGLPYDEKLLNKSKSKPGKSSDSNAEYYDSDLVKSRVAKTIKQGYNLNKSSLDPVDNQLGNYTINRGESNYLNNASGKGDFKVPYYSYYDRWDLDVPGMPFSIDKYNYPFEVYGRIYEEDLEGVRKKRSGPKVMDKYPTKQVGSNTYGNQKAYGGKLDIQSKENINSILGAVSGIAPMFGPVGMGVGAAAMVGSNLLTNNIEKQKMGPHLANFSGYADGGKIKKTVAKRVSPMTVAEKQALAVEYGLKKDGTKGMEKTMEAIASLNPLSNTMSFLAKEDKNPMDYVSLIPGVKAASALGKTANTLNKTSRQARNVKNAQTALRTLDYVDPIAPFIEGGKSHYAMGGPVDPPNIQYVTLGDKKIRFDSNQGVPLMLGGKPMSNRYAVKDIDTNFYIDVERDPISGAYMPATGTIPRFDVDNIIDNRGGGSSSSTKSKSKDRFREFADGGFIGINSSSFKVDGDPNKKDSEFYAPKGVYLDDEEVVKNDSFVFSNRIKNPNTLRTFAKDAQRIEMATKKAEDKFKKYGDSISENTVKYNNMVVDKLAESQEFIATIKGLRDDSKMMANGGPFDPLPGQQFMSTPYSDVFYDPYNKRLVKRLPNGSYINKIKDANDASYIPNQEAISSHLQSYPDPMANPVDIVGKKYNPSTDTIPYKQQDFDVNERMRGMDPFTGVKMRPVGTTTTGPTTGPTTGGYVPSLDPGFVNTPTPPSPVVTTPTVNKTSKSRKPSTAKPTTIPTTPSYTDGRDLLDQSMYANNSLPFEALPIPTLPTSMMSSTALQSSKPVLPPSTIPTGPFFPNTGSNSTKGINSNFTPGDYMQMIAMGSRFLNIGSSEVDRPNLDTTNISKNSYDVNPVLQQNNRNYQNALNNTNAISPNLRRALANQMYATKLQQDSNVMDQYQQMNNQANVDYENRLSNQNRFNAQQTSYTQDINARNRGALRNARQTAYDQIGVAGMMLNDKKQASSYIQALKIRYPDISENILKDILG